MTQAVLPRLREEIDVKLQRAFRTFILASAWLSESELHNALSSPQATISLDYEIKSVMGVKIPVFKLRKEGTIRSYGYVPIVPTVTMHANALNEIFYGLVCFCCNWSVSGGIYVRKFQEYCIVICHAYFSANRLNGIRTWFIVIAQYP